MVKRISRFRVWWHLHFCAVCRSMRKQLEDTAWVALFYPDDLD